VPIHTNERSFTAFEPLGRLLYEHKILPFGVTNVVAAFQIVIDCFIQRYTRHWFKKVYAYLDDLTVIGATLEEHDRNLKALLDAAVSDRITFNKKSQD